MCTCSDLAHFYLVELGFDNVDQTSLNASVKGLYLWDLIQTWALYFHMGLDSFFWHFPNIEINTWLHNEN